MKIELSYSHFSLFGFSFRFSRFFPCLAAVWIAGLLGLSTAVMTGQSVRLLPPELSFDDNEIINNEGWTPYLYSGSSNAAKAATFTARELHSHNWLSIARTSTNNNAGQLMYMESRLADFSGSVVLGSTAWNSTTDAVGLILRASGATFGNANSYYLAVNNAGLALYYGLSDNFTGLTRPELLDRAALPEGVSLGVLGEVSNNQYRLEFSFIGRELQASLYEIQEVGADILLTELQYTDNRAEYREEGWFGLRGGRFGGNRAALFRDLNVSVIPEPGIAVLFVMAGMGAVMFLRRRRQ